MLCWCDYKEDLFIIHFMTSCQHILYWHDVIQCAMTYILKLYIYILKENLKVWYFNCFTSAQLTVTLLSELSNAFMQKEFQFAMRWTKKQPNQPREVFLVFHCKNIISLTQEFLWWRLSSQWESLSLERCLCIGALYKEYFFTPTNNMDFFVMHLKLHKSRMFHE